MSKPEKTLFLDSDDDDHDDADDHDDTTSKKKAALKINKRFAKAYTSRKEQEELRRVQFDVEDGESESSESDEDEEAAFLTAPLQVDIFKTIQAVRNKDARIYDASVKFFPSDDEEEEEDDDDDDDNKDNQETGRARKPKRYKDVLREQVLESMQAMDDNEKTAKPSSATSQSRLAYDQEQQELRKAFLENDNDDDHNDEEAEDWMVVKNHKAKKDDDKATQELEEQLQLAVASLPATSDLQDPRGEVEHGERFLLDYFKNQTWRQDDNDEDDSDDSDDDDSNHKPAAAASPKTPQSDNDDDDSLAEVDEADDFEAQYNFRFEEAAAAATSGADLSNRLYARDGLATFRRKDETRKQARLAKQERKAAERKAKQEELKRLKTLKRKEMQNKLAQVKAVLGQTGGDGEEGLSAGMDEAALLKLLEGDFDPQKFETLMQEMTGGDTYYEQADAEWKTDKDVRKSLVQMEDGALLVGQDDEQDGGLYDDEDDDDDDEENDDDNNNNEEQEEMDDYEEEEWPEEAEDGQEPQEEEPELLQKMRHKMEDDLYKLDYEDIIDGMPTRFKYRKVEPNSFGLSSEEILFARDTTLKQYVSLKKLAPYRDNGEHAVGGKKRKRFRELLQKDLEEQQEEKLPGQEQETNKEASTTVDPEVPSGEKKKRRRLKKKKGRSSDVAEEATEASPSKTESETPAAEEVSNLTPKDEEKEDTKRKRKRRKNKSSSTPTATMASSEASKEDPQDDAAEKSKDSAASQVPVSGPKDRKKVKSEKERSKEQKKHKKDKKKQSKRKTAIEGVSEKRLASYGL